MVDLDVLQLLFVGKLIGHTTETIPFSTLFFVTSLPGSSRVCDINACWLVRWQNNVYLLGSTFPPFKLLCCHEHTQPSWSSAAVVLGAAVPPDHTSALCVWKTQKEILKLRELLIVRLPSLRTLWSTANNRRIFRSWRHFQFVKVDPQLLRLVFITHLRLSYQPCLTHRPDCNLT